MKETLRIKKVNAEDMLLQGVLSQVLETGQPIAYENPTPTFDREHVISTHHIFLTREMTQQINQLEDPEEAIQLFLGTRIATCLRASYRQAYIHVDDWIGHIQICYESDSVVELNSTVSLMEEFFNSPI